MLKDIHRVIGFWIAGVVLVMLASGLPWAGVWGSSFKWVRTELGLIEGPQDWKIGAEGSAAHHAHKAMAVSPAPVPDEDSLPLSTFVRKAEAEKLAFPALVLPPHAPQMFGPPTGDEWTAKSMAQNRPLMRVVTYDPTSGVETGQRGFADQHPIDRAVNYGVAWHEGQLFGLANQLMGLATAIALITVSLLGLWMWWKRRPAGKLGAPPAVAIGRKPGLIAAIVLLAILLPLFGLSLILILTIEKLVIRA